MYYLKPRLKPVPCINLVTLSTSCSCYIYCKRMSISCGEYNVNQPDAPARQNFCSIAHFIDMYRTYVYSLYTWDAYIAITEDLLLYIYMLNLFIFWDKINRMH